jgi:predicted SprT family Zn-dependent metalloprotease
MRPTDDTYSELQQAYDFFNVELFNNQLPACLITLQREKKTYGYFSAQRFVRREDGMKTDEIAMNPAYFAVCPVLEVMQTLVHEMVHLWQQHFGKPGRRRYHNKEWAYKMEAVGLMPSSTGKPGGKKTGESVADYPIDGGPFMSACDRFLKDFKLSWMDRFPARHVTAQALEAAGEGMSSNLGDLGVSLDESSHSKPTRTKYTCPTCETNVWGKPTLKLVCGECGSSYEPSGAAKETEVTERSIALQ